MPREVVTRHLFRRRARAKERQLEREQPGGQFKVVRAFRGPARWYVVRSLRREQAE